MRFVILGILIAVSFVLLGCASAQQQPSAPVCGNSQLEGSEQCESNAPCVDSSKICSQCNCVQNPSAAPARALCGNGKLEGEELCEKGIACPQNGVCDERMCACSYGAPAGEEPQAGADETNLTQGQGTVGAESSIPEQPAPSEAPFCGDGKLAENEECDVGTAAKPAGNKCPSGEYCSSCKCFTQAEPISCRSNNEYYTATGVNEFKQSPFLSCGDDCSFLGIDYKCDLQTCTCIKKTVTSHTCGNGVKEPIEECDGSDTPCSSDKKCGTQCTCVAK